MLSLLFLILDTLVLTNRTHKNTNGGENTILGQLIQGCLLVFAMHTHVTKSINKTTTVGCIKNHTLN